MSRLGVVFILVLVVQLECVVHVHHPTHLDPDLCPRRCRAMFSMPSVHSVHCTTLIAPLNQGHIHITSNIRIRSLLHRQGSLFCLGCQSETGTHCASETTHAQISTQYIGLRRYKHKTRQEDERAYFRIVRQRICALSCRISFLHSSFPASFKYLTTGSNIERTTTPRSTCDFPTVDKENRRERADG